MSSLEISSIKNSSVKTFAQMSDANKDGKITGSEFGIFDGYLAKAAESDPAIANYRTMLGLNLTDEAKETKKSNNNQSAAQNKSTSNAQNKKYVDSNAIKLRKLEIQKQLKEKQKKYNELKKFIDEPFSLKKTLTGVVPLSIAAGAVVTGIDMLAGATLGAALAATAPAAILAIPAACGIAYGFYKMEQGDAKVQLSTLDKEIKQLRNDLKELDKLN